MEQMDPRNLTKTVIRSLLFSSPKPMTINDLHIDHLKSEGHPIPFFSLGYPNLTQFLLSIPDILSISHSGFVIPVASNSRSQHIHELVTSNASTNSNRNRYSLGYNDNYCYQRSHPRIKIDYSSRNFNHEYELIRKMRQLDLKPLQANAADTDKENEESVKVVDQPPVVDVAVPKQLEIDHATTDENGHDQSALPHLDEDDPIHLLGLALPLSGESFKIPSPALTELEPRHTYNVMVTEINRPWSFWFSLCDNKEIDLMEKQLLWHYDGEKIAMKAFEMVVGNACLVPSKEKVLRAEFIEKPINDTVKVCHVDYGTIDVVDTSVCRRMEKYFASIPKQCFPGTLELIQPIETDVEKESLLMQRFEMVRNKPLCGYVIRVDHKKNSVRMVLIDTSDAKEDVIVNRELLAVYKEK